MVFSDVVVNRGGQRALDGLTCDIPLNGVTALVGPSGSGKSTLLRACIRLESPDSGMVAVDGQDLRSRDPRELRRELGMVFQRPTALPGTVADNIKTGAHDLTADQVGELLERAGLGRSFALRPASELSGGEAQRMCLARTLAVRPRVLLLDEPTSALDAKSATIIEKTVTGLAAEGMGVLWVTHNARQVARVADRVLTISRGRAAGIEPTKRGKK